MNKLTQTQQVQEDQYVFPYHYMGLYSERYRKLLHLNYLHKLEVIKDILMPLDGKKLLDVGCGDGRFCYELNSDQIGYVGVDYSDRAITFARAFNPSATFHVVNSSTLSYREEFDVIVMIDVLEHIPPEEATQSLQNIQQALRSGGLFLISVPSTHLPLTQKHYQHFTPEILKAVVPDQLKLKEMLGYGDFKHYYKGFCRASKWADLCWPLQNKMPFVRKFVNSTEASWKKRARCRAQDGINIIGIFEKP